MLVNRVLVSALRSGKVGTAAPSARCMANSAWYQGRDPRPVAGVQNNDQNGPAGSWNEGMNRRETALNNHGLPDRSGGIYDTSGARHDVEYMAGRPERKYTNRSQSVPAEHGGSPQDHGNRHNTSHDSSLYSTQAQLQQSFDHQSGPTEHYEHPQTGQNDRYRSYNQPSNQREFDRNRRPYGHVAREDHPQAGHATPGYGNVNKMEHYRDEGNQDRHGHGYGQFNGQRRASNQQPRSDEFGTVNYQGRRYVSETSTGGQPYRQYSSHAHDDSAHKHDNHVVKGGKSAYEEWQEFLAKRPPSTGRKDATAKDVVKEVVGGTHFYFSDFTDEIVDLFRPKSRRKYPRTF